MLQNAIEKSKNRRHLFFGDICNERFSQNLLLDLYLSSTEMSLRGYFDLIWSTITGVSKIIKEWFCQFLTPRGKLKRASTVADALKNANSDCCYTKPGTWDNGYPAYDHRLEFALLPNSTVKTVCLKKGINILS